MRRLIIALVAGLLVGGALTLAVEHLLVGQQPGTATAKVWRPDAGYWPYPELVDWSKQPAGLKEEIDGAGDRGDCPKISQLMTEQLDREEAAGPEVWTYVERWGVHLKCSSFVSGGPVLTDPSDGPK